MKKIGFTLIELIVVVIILGILAAIAIPMYTNAVEQRKGEACINNIRTIIAAWQIYNMNHAGKFADVYEPGEFYSVDSLNNKTTGLGINIYENNFGRETPGFWMRTDTVNHRFLIRTFRQGGPYTGNSIACAYDYDSNTYNWNPGEDPWVSTWPWLPSDE